MRFLTCHTCATPAATCPVRAALRENLAGLGITTLRHRCPEYRTAFEPGEAVKVTTLAWFHRDDDDPPPKLAFPGHFIRMDRTKALVFVPEGAEDLNGEGISFEPNARGYLKVPLARVAHRDAPSVDVTACRWCSAILGVGDNCARDPHYTPPGHCLAAALRAPSEQAA